MRVFSNSSNFSEIVEILSSVKGQVEGKAGCLSCLILQEINNENHITYEEKWKTQEQLNNHISSDLYRKILAAMDMSDHSPDVEFNSILDGEGMEIVKAIREHYI